MENIKSSDTSPCTGEITKGEESQKRPMNPYVDRKMVKDPFQFYGRSDDLIRIFSRLGGARPQCLSLIGERRIGKSSLLWHIQHPEVFPRYLSEPEHYVFIYIDLQERVAMTVDDFFKLFFQTLYAARPGFPQGKSGDYSAFKELAGEFEKSRTKLILLLDEFDRVTMNTNFDPEFFSFLRSMANRHEMAFITSSSKDLQKLCATKEIEVSPFFNIFTPLHLSVFKPKEAIEFITHSSRKACHPMEMWAEQIMSLSGYHPFFLQIACSAVYEHTRCNEHGDIDWKAVKRAFLNEAGDHFSHFWNHMNIQEREVVTRSTQGEALTRKDRHVLEDLENRGIAYVFRDSHVFFSPLFSEYIMDQTEFETGGSPSPGAPLEEIMVVALFADINSSTPMADILTTVEYASFIHDFKTMLTESFRQYNTDYSEIMGDGFMVQFFRDKPASCVFRALHLCELIRKKLSGLPINVKRLQDSKMPLAMRFGIHAMPTTVGIFPGDATPRAYGFCLNVAKRIEDEVARNAHETGICLSADALRIIEARVQVRPLGKVPLKGIMGSMEIYELVSCDVPYNADPPFPLI
ncbi:MAG: adenylate/guanylate cyclase domain-containing protein [Vulcanimicrobiota bacterium]